MNVEIGTEAAQFPEKEYINGILVSGRAVDNHNSYCRNLGFPWGGGGGGGPLKNKPDRNSSQRKLKMI